MIDLGHSSYLARDGLPCKEHLERVVKMNCEVYEPHYIILAKIITITEELTRKQTVDLSVCYSHEINSYFKPVPSDMT